MEEVVLVHKPVMETLCAMLALEDIIRVTHASSKLYRVWRKEYPPLKYLASVPIGLLQTQACEFVLASSGIEKWLWFVVKRIKLHDQCKITSLFRIVGQCYSYECITRFVRSIRNTVHYFYDMEDSLRIDGVITTPYDQKCFQECLYGICTSKKNFDKANIIQIANQCLINELENDKDKICLVDWEDFDYLLWKRAFEKLEPENRIHDLLDVICLNCNHYGVTRFISRLLEDLPMYRYSILNWYAKTQYGFHTDLPMDDPLAPFKGHLNGYVFRKWTRIIHDKPT